MEQDLITGEQTMKRRRQSWVHVLMMLAAWSINLDISSMDSYKDPHTAVCIKHNTDAKRAFFSFDLASDL